MRRTVFAGSIGDGVHDLRVPRQAVDELGEGVAVGLQFLVGEAGVVQVGEREVALEAAGAAVDRFQVGEDDVVDVGRGDERAVRDRLAARRTGRDPLLDGGDLGFARPRLLVGRRHGAVVDAA